tara:strand:- start:18528 stop:19109 length:582 start_codon:yes stop_codon:yes gene_type:complete
MSKKDKLGLDKVINRFNKEFEKTSSQFNKIVSDAFKQLETFQSHIQDPIKKVIEDFDKLRDREMNRFQSEFDKKLNEFHELQSQLLEKIGVEQAKPASKKTSKAKPDKTNTAAKKAPAKKTSTKAPAKTNANPKLADINGVGPATIKKLNNAGITEVSQLAKPSQKDKKILEGFIKTKGFDTWQEQANKLIKS